MTPAALTGFGVDTVRVAVPFGGWRKDGCESTFNNRGGLVLRGGASVWLFGGRAMVEASLPRRVFGSNVNPLPFSLLTSATDELISEVGEHLIIRSDLSLEEVSVKRVDIVRDFHNVDQIGPLLQGLSTVPRRRGLKRHLHGDVAWETLTVGVGAWSVSLYDKEAETKGVARPGHLRCEIRLRPKRLTSVWARLHGGCVNVVPDVSTEKMECLARASFEEVGFHRTVVPPDEAVRRA